MIWPSGKQDKNSNPRLFMPSSRPKNCDVHPVTTASCPTIYII